ncbi:sugar phosphate isomerase/epimerase [Rubellimicrobium rubrum]|uniref:Sugar phosphate isomerase/epimerase n=2 Tax=Rubellimicrobium rubrum TaxID=2585369 RepID=A0A5C4N2N5_9RHOB|nr:sugar phosphate isomerase/epimerase [Rubellimicrobium rubrum]
MLGPAWRDRPDDVIGAIAAAGYAGIEISDAMLGCYSDDPGGLACTLDRHRLELVAVAVSSASGFTERDRAEGDLEGLRHWLDFVAHFPGAVISLGSATAVTGGPRDDKLAVAAEIYNRTAMLGATVGVEVAIHPSSHRNTLLFDRADYDRMFSLLDRDSVGWVPDTGHILRGHADIFDTLRAHRDRIRYLHLKDADARGRWAMLGQGGCDIGAVLEVLNEAPRFNHWVVVEEESDEAAADPATAVATNRALMRTLGF